MIIDAHHHLWDPGRRRHAWLDPLRALRRPFTLEEFTGLAAAQGVTSSLLVQVLPSAAETAEFLGVAGTGTLVAGVVGWADLTGRDVAGEIARLRGLPGGDRLSGIRHLVQDEPDPDWLDRPDVRRGLRAVGEAGPGYSAARIGPYAARLIDSFGPDRLMFGSDWPVCTLAASYGEVLDLAVALLAGRLGPAGVDAVLAGNAARFYGLGGAASPGSQD